jgi:hypothetical protein
VENPPFFLILPLDQIAIEPLDCGGIYKTILIFQFNQLNPSLIDSSTFNYFIITPDEIN